jgi:hypothetical protein
MIDENIESGHRNNEVAFPPRVVSRPQYSSSQDTYLAWLAVGAVAAGAIAAIIGCMQPRGRRMTWTAEPDHGELTPPHGDKFRREQARSRAAAGEVSDLTPPHGDKLRAH